jgi:hypothetical protein
MRKVILILPILTAIFLVGCSLFGTGLAPTDDPKVTGGGIRTTNGEVLGRIKFSDASPAEGLQIRLYKIYLSAVQDSFQAEWAGISDSVGIYQFSNVPAGRFVMTVTDQKSGEMAIMPRLIKGTEGYFVLDALLSPWVTLVGRVIPQKGHPASEVKVCIPGVPQCAIPGPDSIYTFPQAPQGEYDLVFIQDTVANYLPIQVLKGAADTLFVKDIKFDQGVLVSASSSKNFSFYDGNIKRSLYVLPTTYLAANVPTWQHGKKFDGIRYFVAVENKQFEQYDIEDYLDWIHSKSIAMPLYRPTGADSAALIDFTYLLRLTATNFDFSQAGDLGKDFRVGRGNGRHLPYYIERWDSAAGLADIWVRIDTLEAKNSAQSLVYYWGNEHATDRSFSSTLLSRNENERMVWLLNENSTSSLVTDRSKRFPGYLTTVGIGKGMTKTNTILGVIARGLWLNGTNDVITIDPHPILDFPAFTVSLWAKNDLAKLPVQQYIILKGDNGSRQWHLALDETSNIRFGVGGHDGQWSGAMITIPSVPNPNQWHQYVGTYSAGVIHIYVDGVEYPTRLTGTIPLAIPDHKAGITLGVPLSTHGTYWKGQIDNFTYDSKIRSLDWIKMVYENQKL